MESKQKCKLGSMAIKFDMSKGYDRVEWFFFFFEVMLRKLDFSTRWTSLLIKCVTSVSYSILVSGNLADDSLPSRGLRQVDPLSPYLFLICAEGLSSLLQEI